MRGGGVKVASFLGGLRSDANIHGGSTKESYTGGMGFDKGFHGCTGGSNMFVFFLCQKVCWVVQAHFCTPVSPNVSHSGPPRAEGS